MGCNCLFYGCGVAERDDVKSRRERAESVSILLFGAESDNGNSTAMKILLKKHSPRIVFFMPFSNLPNELISITWYRTLSEVEELDNVLREEDFITTTEVNLVYNAENHDTWRDKKLFDDIKALERK